MGIELTRLFCQHINFIWLIPKWVLFRNGLTMKARFIFIISLAFFNVAQATQLTCNKSDIPTVIKPMENWEIIATNTGEIAMAGVFSGKELTYIVSAHPKNLNNKVTINKTTGVIQVKAEKKDNFNVTVKAKNACETASDTFNIIIDEEE